MENVDGKPSLAKSLRFKTMATVGGGFLGYALGSLRSNNPEVQLSGAEVSAGMTLLYFSGSEILNEDKDHPRPFIHKLISHVGVMAGGALMGAAFEIIPGLIIGPVVAEVSVLTLKYFKGRNRINPVPHTL